MNRTSIYTIPVGEEPVWVYGVPNYGWQYVTKPSLPLPADDTSAIERHVIHCAEGTEPPSNAILVIIKGHVTQWTPEMVVAAWPNGHLYVMEAKIPGSCYMGPTTRRVKMIEIPEGVTPIETLLIPHEWAGDGL